MKPMSSDSIAHEHSILVGQFGRVQRRCSELIASQVAEIEQLRAEVMRLHGALIARDTALAFAREDRAALEALAPGLPRRALLARQVQALQSRVRQLLRERTVRPDPVNCPDDEEAAATEPSDPAMPASARRLRLGGELALIEASGVAANLVICQTGCVAHDFHWRIRDHCRRTGIRCVWVADSTVVAMESLSDPGVEQPS